MLRENEIELRDYLDERLVAKVDAEHCVRLNYEAFFFGDLWNRERFASDPSLYCGFLTDPVSRQRFRPQANSPRRKHEGVLYFFQDKEQRDEFTDDPNAYRLPGWKM